MQNCSRLFTTRSKRILQNRLSHFFSHSIIFPFCPHFLTWIRAFSFLQHSVIKLIPPPGVIHLLPGCNGMSSDHSTISTVITCISYNITIYVLTTSTILGTETNDMPIRKLKTVLQTWKSIHYFILHYI